MADLAEELELIKGSTLSFEVHLKDENDNPESLTGAQQASITIRDNVDASGFILERKVSAGNLTIDVTNSKLVATISQAEADALTPGDYIAEAAVRYGATDWRHTDPFYVRVKKSMAPHA